MNSKISVTPTEILSVFSEMNEFLPKREFKKYEPSVDFNSNDYASIVLECNKIASFIGLHDYLINVNFDWFFDKAGEISLNWNSNKEVNICLSKNILGKDMTALAVISHEICHKLLFIHGLYWPNDERKTELYTDLCTFYVGLGRLTLNGCETTETDSYSTVTVGYLSRNNYENANRIIEKVENDTLYQDENTFHRTLDDLLREHQMETMEITRHVTFLEEYLNEIKREVSTKNINLRDKFCSKRFQFQNGRINNRYFAEMIRSESPHVEFKDLREKICTFNHSLAGMNERELFLEHANQKLKLIKCPACDYCTKKPVYETKVYKIKCPKCDYIFRWDSTPIEAENQIPNSKSKRKQFRSFFTHFKKKDF